MDQIIRGCKKRQADCQKLLYQQQFSLMMNICTRYAGTREDAEEMLNNGFLKIFSYIDQYEGKGSFEGWMKRVMVNSCLDFLKSKNHRNNSKLVVFGGEDVPPADLFDHALYQQGVYAENGNEKKFNAQELVTLLNILPEQTRTVFNLFVFEAHSHKEIATLLDMAERTSQWHLAVARKTLSEALANNNYSKKIAGL
jgi:RNA polymerase sigma-70 factor (ECF subfamily)